MSDDCVEGCRQARCGDGFLWDGIEACDDGNLDSEDLCTNRCTIARCGDGVIQRGIEECDDGDQIAQNSCTNQCTLPTCGDGIVQRSLGEECDDQNQLNGDGCSTLCRLESCGDGIVQQSEACDDGNLINEDSCTNNCRLAECGDQIVQVGVEECDDGDSISENDCTNTCRFNICGDGFTYQSVEQCDDGNNDDSDQCASDCTLTYCGDGVTQNATEECDDGNQANEDRCLPNCQLSDRCGDSLLWNGTNSAMWTSLDLTSSGQFEAWVYLESYPSVGSEATLIAYGDPQGIRQLRLSISSDGLLQLVGRSPYGEYRAVGLSRELPLHKWTHIIWDSFGEETTSNLSNYEDYGFSVLIDGLPQIFAGYFSGAWGTSVGLIGSQTLYLGARPETSEEGGGLGDVLHGSMKHISLWTRESGVTPRSGLNADERARALSPEAGSFGLIANWKGEGNTLDEAIIEVGGRSMAISEISIEDQGCLPRRFECDNSLIDQSICAQTSQNVPHHDDDEDGLINIAETTCGLNVSLDDSVSDLNNNGTLDHDACLSLQPILPMFTMRVSPDQPYAVELWLNQPIERLSPTLIELFIDFDEAELGFVQESTGPAAIASQSSLLVALTEPNRDLLRVTVLGISGRSLLSGHLGTVYFSPLSSGEVNTEITFDLDQYQVAPAYIFDYVTFGAGGPTQPLHLP